MSGGFLGTALGYGFIALLVLGLATVALVRGASPLAGRAVAYVAGFAAAAAVASLARRTHVTRAVWIGLAVAIVSLFVLNGVYIVKGWADADCQYLNSCGAPDWPWLAWLSLVTSVGAGALFVVVKVLAARLHGDQDLDDDE